MQVYNGFEIVTKSITHTEKQGVRRYLLGEIVPDSDFIAEYFCLQVIAYIEIFLKTQRVPIIVGGSNSYIEKLVESHVFIFKYKYDTFFIWIYIEQSILNRRVDLRVVEMVNAGLVDELRQIIIPDADYTKGIRQSIGVPEMDRYLRKETIIDKDDESKKMILQSSIANIMCSTPKMNTFINNNKFNKKKVVFIMGAIGTGKSRLSVDLASHFQGEIINSDKMQIYKGLEIVTNKITYIEKQGVRHYLLVIVGGSNSHIEKLVEDPVFMFKYKYDTCFILIDVEQSVLNRRVDKRVDEIVNAGNVDDVRLNFIPDADYTKGIQQFIGIFEMDIYLREETNIDEDDVSKKTILQ
ncbi:hypothetical protein H5410_020907 [Solanum commersonii]|uniref:Uncharacterized protein n=1 Tax=Solanum commersonii TaxID=4109 RepID=A0A9J5ZAF1_SOLCO|nr:hypothetical protein H5410_020907 [Solanum commersonii]